MDRDATMRFRTLLGMKQAGEPARKGGNESDGDADASAGKGGGSPVKGEKKRGTVKRQQSKVRPVSPTIASCRSSWRECAVSAAVDGSRSGIFSYGYWLVHAAGAILVNDVSTRNLQLQVHRTRRTRRSPSSLLWRSSSGLPKLTRSSRASKLSMVTYKRW